MSDEQETKPDEQEIKPDEQETKSGFTEFGLAAPLLKALDEVGYETPSPIQSQIIPHVLAGRDVVGQAQTGTGKTAAFALPLLSTLDLKKKTPQVMVLAPTRELAIQVAEAFQKYAKHLKGFHVLPVYGGQDYSGQLRALRRGVHVVVGTPGRVMDHMRRGTLNLEGLTCLVLDEADEMLRMGFIDDVDWILEQTPEGRQVALFSATMPAVIRRIAQRHLNKPAEITIQMRTTVAETIRQRCWVVSGYHKLDALTRILEVEPYEGMIIFVRTKTATVELAEKLAARGHSSAPLNGDIPQKQRERTVEKLKSGKIDILVATDVAARGLDVDRISHVINYDIPYDTEAYVHRIGRTGRMGRSGEAILFVAPRERRLLRALERATNQKVEAMTLPSTETINDARISRFKERITETLAGGKLDMFKGLIEEYTKEHEVSAEEVAAALARLIQGDTPLLLEDKPQRTYDKYDDGPPRRDSKHPPRRERPNLPPRSGTERFRMDVGHMHGVGPGNIVGAITNEAEIGNEHIGRIYIYDDHSTVDLPQGMPREILDLLKKVWVSGQRLNIRRMDDSSKSDDKQRAKPKRFLKDRPKKRKNDK